MQPPATIRTSLASLPPAARAHLIENLAGRGPLPITLARRGHGAGLAVTAAVICALVLWLLVLVLGHDLGSLTGELALLGAPAIIWLTLATTGAALVLGALVTRRRTVRRLGFRPGTYLLGAFVVEAGDTIVIEPIARTRVERYQTGGGHELVLHGDHGDHALGVHPSWHLRAVLIGVARTLATHDAAVAAGARIEAAMWDPLGPTRALVDAERTVVDLRRHGARRVWAAALAVAVLGTPAQPDLR